MANAPNDWRSVIEALAAGEAAALRRVAEVKAAR